MTTDLQAARRNQIPRGILYMVASTVVFAGVNAIVKWELALLPDRRGRVLPLAVGSCRGLRVDPAAHRLGRVAHEPIPRACSARPVAVRLDDLHDGGVQPVVAGLGGGDQLCRATVHDIAVDRRAEGAGRHPPLVGIGRRVYRRPGGDASRRLDIVGRRLFRARQRGADLVASRSRSGA